MNIKKIIYVSDPYGSAVTQSQVYNLLEYYYKQNYFQEVILIQIYSNKSNLLKAKEILGKYQFEKVFIKGKLGLTISFNPIIWRIKKALDNIINCDNFIIHARTEMLGYHVVKALKKKKLPLNILVDIRGTTIEEIEYRLKYGKEKTLYLKYLKYLYQKLPGFYTRNNIAFSAVSDSLKIYLTEKGYNNYCKVHPNIVAESFAFNPAKRNEIRKKLKIKDNQIFIVLSSGGNSVWQKDQTIINYFANREEFKVLNLSKTSIDQCGVINMFLPFEEMPDYLSAADVAVLWRDKHILNTCASPSKFSEFASMGIYVIHNGSVNLVNKYLKENKAGILVDSIDNLSIEKSIVFDLRKRQERVNIGRTNFGVEFVSKGYFDYYFKIISKNILDFGSKLR